MIRKFISYAPRKNHRTTFSNNIQIEAALFEQDHRIVPVLRRFFIDRPKWEKDDPRRWATVKALIWLVLFSPTAVTTGGGLIALLTLCAFVYQNSLMRSEIENNAKIQQASQEHSSYVALADATSTPPQLKRLAIDFLQEHRRPRNQELDFRDSFLNRVDLTNATLKNLTIENTQLVDAICKDTVWLHVNATRATLECDLIKVRFTDCILANSVVGFEIARSNRVATISGMISGCDFEDAKLCNVCFENTKFQDCNFKNSNFVNTNFKSVQFLDCVLDGSNVQNPTLGKVDFKGSSLKLSTVPASFKTWAQKYGASF